VGEVGTIQAHKVSCAIARGDIIGLKRSGRLVVVSNIGCSGLSSVSWN
jgi:hypothetical protein